MNSEKVISNIKKAIKEHFDSNYTYDMLVDFELDVIEWYSLFEYIDKLKQENKQLQEELKLTIGIVEHNRIISEKNREIRQLKIQIFSEKKELCNKLESNWNKLKEYLKEKIAEERSTEHLWLMGCYDEDKLIFEKMQELEQGSDSK